LVWKPKPMMVLQAIIDGLSVTARAAVMASRIASVSWPSISWTCQPEARKRSTSSSETGGPPDGRGVALCRVSEIASRCGQL
jgi:hypothetical protein